MTLAPAGGLPDLMPGAASDRAIDLAGDWWLVLTQAAQTASSGDVEQGRLPRYITAVIDPTHRALGVRNREPPTWLATLVQESQNIIAFAEAAARSVIDEENSFVDGYAIDDNEHLPRIRRIIEAVAKAALSAGASRAAVADLRQRLLAFAEDEYMKRWMADIYEDEDPEEVRRDGVSVFRHVIAGGRR